MIRPALTRALIAAGLLLVLGSVNFAIFGKERIIRDGETIFLALAPVDPRSLMQGDYMALRFELAAAIEVWREDETRAHLRAAPLDIDARGIATLAAGPENGRGDDGFRTQPRLAFRVRGYDVWLGTNAFFFTEGTADRYTTARYGEFRFDRDSGEAVLVGLRNDALERL